mgnify:CR=1 FL=1
MLKTKFHTTMVMNKYTKHLIPAILAGMLTLYTTSVTAGNEQRSGQAGASELLINPWARSSGWGGINTASVSGLEATFMNVAGMAHTENTEFIFSSTSWFSDIKINAFGFQTSESDDITTDNSSITRTGREPSARGRQSSWEWGGLASRPVRPPHSMCRPDAADKAGSRCNGLGHIPTPPSHLFPGL